MDHTFTPSRAFLGCTGKAVLFSLCIQSFSYLCFQCDHVHYNSNFSNTVALSMVLLWLMPLQDNKTVTQYDRNWFYYPPLETIFSYASDIGRAVSINTFLWLMSSKLDSTLQKATRNFNVRSVRGRLKYGRANDQLNCYMKKRSNTLWFVYSWNFIEWNPVVSGLVQRFWSVATSTFKSNPMHTKL